MLEVFPTLFQMDVHFESFLLPVAQFLVQVSMGGSHRTPM